jgi:hypothetical protein
MVLATNESSGSSLLGIGSPRNGMLTRSRTSLAYIIYPTRRHGIVFPLENIIKAYGTRKVRMYCGGPKGAALDHQFHQTYYASYRSAVHTFHLCLPMTNVRSSCLLSVVYCDLCSPFATRLQTPLPPRVFKRRKTKTIRISRLADC